VLHLLFHSTRLQPPGVDLVKHHFGQKNIRTNFAQILDLLIKFLRF
jgi:hypothetical protein